MPEEVQSCGNCKFMMSGGICARYPPFNDVWPTVEPDEWCGEWQPKPIPESPAYEAAEKAAGEE